LLAIAAITYIDTVTNPDLALIPFYLLPVVTLTLVLGPGMGILSAGFAACSWLLAEHFSGVHPTHPAVPYWNALMNLAIFFGVSLVVAKIRRDAIVLRRDKIRIGEQNEEILKLAKTKSDFCAMVSHDLRTPMATIRESVALIQEGLLGEVNEEQKRYLAIAQKNTERLIHLVNEVLDFTQLDQGQKKLKWERCDLSRLVDESVKFLEPLARKKGLALRGMCGPQPCPVDCDEESIVEILNNLIGNAIKFTQTGDVLVTLTQKNGESEIAVRDSGCGIPPGEIGRLFKPFERIAWKSGMKVEGSGLGLAITRYLVELHGGKIWAESEFGKGTTIRFSIPIQRKV
jgi:signal transduction histidine kinase